MKNLTLITLISTTLLCAGCESVTNLQNKLADLTMQKKQLANGNTVYLGTNVLPTPAWNCKMVDNPQAYRWTDLRSTTFTLNGGPSDILAQKAMAYANQQNLNINYINLQIPEEKTFSTGTSRLYNELNLQPNMNAFAGFYMCEKINPDRKIGSTEKTNTSIFLEKSS